MSLHLVLTSSYIKIWGLKWFYHLLTHLQYFYWKKTTCLYWQLIFKFKKDIVKWKNCVVLITNPVPIKGNVYLSGFWFFWRTTEMKSAIVITTLVVLSLTWQCVCEYFYFFLVEFRKRSCANQNSNSVSRARAIKLMKQPMSWQLGSLKDFIISLGKMKLHKLFFQKNIINFVFFYICLGMFLLAVNFHNFLFFLQCQFLMSWL